MHIYTAYNIPLHHYKNKSSICAAVFVYLKCKPGIYRSYCNGCTCTLGQVNKYVIGVPTVERAGPRPIVCGDSSHIMSELYRVPCSTALIAEPHPVNTDSANIILVSVLKYLCHFSHEVRLQESLWASVSPYHCEIHMGSNNCSLTHWR